MPLYRIYRMKDSPRQQFRWAPHVSGAAAVKLRDYEPGDQIEAVNEYDAWRQLRESSGALTVGDLLATEDGQLRICKYVGFEPAQWVLPEPTSVT
jgi:SH3-like domain-containing protein